MAKVFNLDYLIAVSKIKRVLRGTTMTDEDKEKFETGRKRLAEYRERLHLVLERQKQGLQPTVEDQHKQMMLMNECRSVMFADGKRKLVWGDDDQLVEVILEEHEQGPDLTKHFKKHHGEGGDE